MNLPPPPPPNVSLSNSPFIGHGYRLALGSTLNLEKESGKDLGATAEPMFKYGYEYGLGFGNSYYFGLDITWTIAYPRNFEGKFNKPLSPPLALWWIPISNVKIGKFFKDGKLLVTAGVIYLWGASFSVASAISEKSYLDLRTIIWLDRVFDADGVFGKGFDNAHFSIGFGRKL